MRVLPPPPPYFQCHETAWGRYPLEVASVMLQALLYASLSLNYSACALTTHYAGALQRSLFGERGESEEDGAAAASCFQHPFFSITLCMH